MEHPLISVALATYNGGKYLQEQIQSILTQTYPNIEVVVFDDNSTDATQNILAEMSEKYSNIKVHVNKPRVGVVQNFSKALEATTGQYVALCDQDDVWLPHKLEASLECLQRLEKKKSANLPALVFTDLSVVNEQLQEIDRSYWHFMHLNPENHSFNRVLVENVATGCTILMNRATLEQALPIPPEALMHDVWLLLHASYFGQVDYLPQPTVLYRQHISNAIGAQQKGLTAKMNLILKKALKNDLALMDAEIKQAISFYKRHQNSLGVAPNKKEILEAFISLKEQNFITRKKQLIKYRFFRSSIKTTLSLLLRA